MTDEQIRLYAACRVACPSPMIRLRSVTDGNRLIVVATRQPFQMVARSDFPRVIPAPSAPTPLDIRHYGPKIEAFDAERAWIAFDRFVFWDYGPVAYKLAAEELAVAIFRGFRRAGLNIRL